MKKIVSFVRINNNNPGYVEFQKTGISNYVKEHNIVLTEEIEIEVNVPSESNAENAVGMRNLLSEVLTASDFIVDCTGGMLSTLLGNNALNKTGTQVLVHDSSDWVLATPS